MATVNELIGLLYSLIRETWFIASISAKYFLAGNAVYLVYREKFTVENYLNSVLEYGRDFIFFVTGLGIVAIVSGLELRPVASFFSQFVAVVYLGYLFWKY